jgi:DNA-binding NtrC family response regulator
MAAIAIVQNENRQTRPVPSHEARIQRAVARIAESDCPVLILGEHGAGKRFLASQIHARSSRVRSAFQEIRCGDTSATALQAALSARGTVYLSEINELSLPLQELIVRNYLQPEQMQGSRLLCGSSRELAEEVKTWRMREDFFHLVSAVTLRVPPLRCRKSEILSIADELLTRYAKQFDRPKPVLCKEIISYLMEYAWPDNLPELQTAIKTFVAIGDQAISLAAIKAASASGKSNASVAQRGHASLVDSGRTTVDLRGFDNDRRQPEARRGRFGNQLQGSAQQTQTDRIGKPICIQ